MKVRWWGLGLVAGLAALGVVTVVVGRDFPNRFSSLQVADIRRAATSDPVEGANGGTSSAGFPIPGAPSSALTATPEPERRKLPAPAVSLAADPRDGAVVYALLETNVLYRSEDGGGAWRRLPLPIPDRSFDPPPNGQMRNDVSLLPQQGVQIAPSDPSRIFVVPQRPGDVGPLFRSDDRGATWQLSLDHVRAWTLADPQGNILYAWRGRGPAQGTNGLFRSADAGKTWQQVYSGYLPPWRESIYTVTNHEGPTVLLVRPVDANTIYAGMDYGVYRSVNGGMTGELFDMGFPPTTRTYRWVPIMVAVSDGTIYALVEVAEDPRGPQLASLVRLRPGEKAWVPVGGETLKRSLSPSQGFGGFETLVVDPIRPSRLYAGTNRGLLVSDNAGENWQSVEIPGVEVVFRLAVGRDNMSDSRNTLYLWTDAGFIAWQEPGGR